VDWDLIQTGPADASHTVLLLPGGLLAARTYTEVMAEPALRGVRLVAATLPGHAGTMPPADTSIETYARLAGELAKKVGADVVVGSSIGATVAVEMLASGTFTGPTVLLEVSLSPRDEPLFFRAIVSLGSVLGSLPSSVLIRMSATLVRHTSVSSQRSAEYATDFRRNQPSVIRRILRDYLLYLEGSTRPAARLCGAGVLIWILHAEHGDGKLSAGERRTLQACPDVTIATLPGTSYLLSSERPREVGECIAAALRGL
jgi:pimeloyl-ACP methyl ester carboxylesterase